LDGDLPLKWEVYNMLVSGWSPEAIRVHFAKIGRDVSVSAISEFREIIPEQDFLPFSGMSERFKGRSVRVDPIDELHRALAAMRERANAALLLEEISGEPDKLTSDLLDKYASALVKAATLQQATGDIPNKNSAPGSGQGGGVGAPTIQVLMQTILQSRPTDDPRLDKSPDHPVQSSVVVEGVVHELLAGEVLGGTDAGRPEAHN